MMSCFQIDVFGACGRQDPCRRNDSCLENMFHKYKFYLAFENSFCEDYITGTPTCVFRMAECIKSSAWLWLENVLEKVQACCSMVKKRWSPCSAVTVMGLTDKWDQPLLAFVGCVKSQQMGLTFSSIRKANVTWLLSYLASCPLLTIWTLHSKSKKKNYFSHLHPGGLLWWNSSHVWMLQSSATKHSLFVTFSQEPTWNCMDIYIHTFCDASCAFFFWWHTCIHCGYDCFTATKLRTVFPFLLQKNYGRPWSISWFRLWWDLQ